MGSFEGGLTIGWLPWHSFGQEYAWNYCAQRLIGVAPDGSVVYDLAKSHAVSADGKEYTFTLLADAKWQDGSPVTAADVAFSYNTGLKAKAGSTIIALIKPVAGSQAVIDDNSKEASGIQVVDDHTIKFVLDQPNAGILAVSFGTIFIAPKKAFDGIALEDYITQDIATNLFIGSGAYKMVASADKQFVNMEANPDYVNGDGWKGLPGADAVSIRIYGDDNAQLTSTQAGEVDFQYFRKPTRDKLTQLEAIPGMAAQKSKVGLNIFYSFFLGDDKGQPPNAIVKDKRFRQATVWALDRSTLVNDVLGGVHSVPKIMNQWIVPWANSDKLVKYDPQDIDKAKQLLADAGYKGEEIQVFNFPKPDPDLPVILQMWKDVGINTKVHEYGADTFFDEFYTTPKYDIGFAYGFGTISGLPWNSDQFLSSKSFPQNGGLNSMRFASAEWDKEYEAALLAPTQEGQAPHFQRASEIFNDELPYVALYQRVDYTIVSDNLRGPEKAINGILHPNQTGVKYWEWYIHS